jgi:proteasome lid subunit RPN8/RPN11
MTSGTEPPACRPPAVAVRIAPAVLDVVIEHARTLVPDECCGLLLGDERCVRLAWPARNELASPTRYRVDPRDYLAACHYGRKHGLDVIGAYHSHPRTPARPSATDLAESAGERFVYLIVGQVAAWPDAPEIRAFRFGEGNFEELAIVRERQEFDP